MAFSFALIRLAGTIALLLWGTHMVQTGIQRAFGPQLKSILGRALANRTSAALTGAGVTALLQSSTATGLMATGFVAGGFVDLVPGLAVMLGANVGTALIVQILSFDVAMIAPALILIGFIMFRRVASARTHDLGRVFIGLGLMLFALHDMLAMMAPYETSASFRTILNVIVGIPVLDLISGALFTWAVHSSVASVLLVVSLATAGTLPMDAAFAFVLGANIGTAINPILEGASGHHPIARRLPVGNFMIRCAGAFVVLAVVEPVSRWIVTFNSAHAVANFHTSFNLALALVFLPLLTPYAQFLQRLIPNRTVTVDPSRPMYLDHAARETPIIALGGAAREALRLADVLEEMLRGARETLIEGDRKLISATKRLDDVLDRLNNAIKTYLTAIDPEELSEGDQTRLNEILIFAMNLEQAGDVVEHNLLPHMSKRMKRGLSFSQDGRAELTSLMDRLIANLRRAASLFMTDDLRAARLLAGEKVALRRAEAEATRAHFARLRNGQLDSVQTSALHLDLLRDIKLVNSHIVAAAAYPVLERNGDLLPSRLASAN